MRIFWLWALCACLSAGVCLAQENKENKENQENPPAQQAKQAEQAEAPAKDTAPTHTVASGPFRITVDAKGYFQPEQLSELELDLKTWSASKLKVIAAVSHGQSVKKGDVLLQLDTEDIDKAIVEAGASAASAKLALEQAERELASLELTTPMNLQAAQRTKQQADEDLEYFLKISRPHSEDDAHYSIKRAKHRLSYETEELTQLKKMYEADDLTEETEEIILIRQQHSVEGAQRGVANTERQSKHTLETTLPRKEIAAHDRAQRAAIALDDAKVKLPVQLEQKRLALAKAQRASEKADLKLAELEEDRQALTLTAPTDGIVYLGRHDAGQWKQAGGLAKQILAGKKIAAASVHLTMIQPRPVIVEITVPEEKLRWVVVDKPVNLTPTAYPDSKLVGRVRSVTSAPASPGSFNATIEVNADQAPATLTAGMSSKVEVVFYESESALTVPAAAVKDDKDNPTSKHVMIKTDAGQEKRNIKVGQTFNDVTEILDGLAEDDQVVMQDK